MPVQDIKFQKIYKQITIYVKCMLLMDHLHLMLLMNFFAKTRMRDLLRINRHGL